MHGGSSKRLRIDNDSNWNSLEPCIPPGVSFFTLHVPIESDLHMIPIEVEYQMKVFEVKDTWYTKANQMYEHIAYELRYEYLSSIEHGSICMKAQLI